MFVCVFVCVGADGDLGHPMGRPEATGCVSVATKTMGTGYGMDTDKVPMAVGMTLQKEVMSNDTITTTMLPKQLPRLCKPH